MNTHRVTRRSHAGSRGAAFVEFALVVVIVCGLVFGTAVYSRRMRLQLIASDVARFAAQVLYRRCNFMDESVMPGCVTEIVARLDSYVTNVLDERIAVRLAYVRQAGLVATDPGPYSTPTEVTSAVSSTAAWPVQPSWLYPVSHFVPIGSPVVAEAAEIFQTHGRVWVAEVAVDVSAKAWGDFIVGWITAGNGIYYDAAFS
jgi:Flp pilus assembly protein TadG